MKRVLILGLGRFGRRLITALSKRKAVSLFGFDRDEKVVERWVDKLYTAGSGDLNDPDALTAFLEEIGPVDVAVVSLGAEINASLLAAIQLREVGVPKILIKALDESHRRVLRSIDHGAEGPERFEVLIPELDAAEQLAHSLSSELVVTNVPLASSFQILEVRCPEDFAGKTLRELDLRGRFKVMVVGFRQSESEESEDTVMPDPDLSLPSGCLLTVLGRQEDLEALEREHGS